MRTVNIHEAKTHFSKLVEQAEKGETIIIARAGKPVARVAPLGAEPAKPKARYGFMAGEIKVPDDFDTMFQDEIEEMFYGKP